MTKSWVSEGSVKGTILVYILWMTALGGARISAPGVYLGGNPRKPSGKWRSEMRKAGNPTKTALWSQLPRGTLNLKLQGALGENTECVLSPPNPATGEFSNWFHLLLRVDSWDLEFSSKKPSDKEVQMLGLRVGWAHFHYKDESQGHGGQWRHLPQWHFYLMACLPLMHFYHRSVLQLTLDLI